MGRRAEESISSWYERAIVTNSIAADDLHQMESSVTEFNPQARKAITHHADDAEQDLADALAAYNKQRASEKNTENLTPTTQQRSCRGSVTPPAPPPSPAGPPQPPGDPSSRGGRVTLEREPLLHR